MKTEDSSGLPPKRRRPSFAAVAWQVRMATSSAAKARTATEVVEILERYQKRKLVRSNSTLARKTVGKWKSSVASRISDAQLMMTRREQASNKWLNDVISLSSEDESRWRRVLEKIKHRPICQYVVLFTVLLLYLSLGTLLFVYVERNSQEWKEQEISDLAQRLALLECNTSVQILQKKLMAEPLVGSDKNDWNLWNGLFYCLTVITTIGYGTLCTRTLSGKILSVIYALIGIPIFLVVLESIGRFFYKLMKKMKRVFRRCKKQSESAAEEPDERVPIVCVMAVVALYVLACAGLFMLSERWDLVTSLYFTFASMSTIGFGDVVPADARVRVFSFVLIIVGLALLSMCLSIVQERMDAKYMKALELIEESYLSSEQASSSKQAEDVRRRSASVGVTPITQQDLF